MSGIVRKNREFIQVSTERRRANPPQSYHRASKTDYITECLSPETPRHESESPILISPRRRKAEDDKELRRKSPKESHGLAKEVKLNSCALKSQLKIRKQRVLEWSESESPSPSPQSSPNVIRRRASASRNPLQRRVLLRSAFEREKLRQGEQGEMPFHTTTSMATTTTDRQPRKLRLSKKHSSHRVRDREDSSRHEQGEDGDGDGPAVLGTGSRGPKRPSRLSQNYSRRPASLEHRMKNMSLVDDIPSPVYPNKEMMSPESDGPASPRCPLSPLPQRYEQPSYNRSGMTTRNSSRMSSVRRANIPHADGLRPKHPQVTKHQIQDLYSPRSRSDSELDSPMPSPMPRSTYNRGCLSGRSPR